MGKEQPISLFQWIWRTYIKTSVVPLVLVQLVFIAIYFLTNEWSRERQILSMKNEVLNEMKIVAAQEASLIESQTYRISTLANLYRDSVADVLKVSSPASEEDIQRLDMNTDGAYYSITDSSSGGVAVFYSGLYEVGEKQKEKVSSLLALQPFMKSMMGREPLASAVYYNTYDSLNIIYPYFDVMTQYAAKMDIPSYNFYYEADSMHNPDREVVWTDAYLDPAGNGWLASAIAPVYSGEILEGVVGIDVTVETFKNQVLELSLPWEGLGMLVSNNGVILAMPDKAEQLFGIKEPDEFNLFTHKDLKQLRGQLTADNNGLNEVEIAGHKQILAWSTIDNTDWKLLVMASEDNIFAATNQLKQELMRIGFYMIAGLIFFYIIYFTVLYRRAKVMSERMSKPLMDINNMAVDIGAGIYEQQLPDIPVNEMRETASILVDVGKTLGASNKALTEAREALESREADMNAMMQSIDDIIVEIDEHAVIERIWTIGERFSLERAKSYEGSNVNHLFDEETAYKFNDILKEVLITGQTVGWEYALQTTLGLRWMQAHITPIHKKNRPTRKVCMISRDITDRKQIEESMLTSKEIAEKANKAKSEFLSNMSHELRTPMNAILGFAQLLEYDTSEPLSRPQQENVAEIIKAGKHLLDLISEILDLSRIESGRLALYMENVRVGDILEECFTWVQPICSQSGIQLQNDALPMYEELIFCDRMRLKQVVLNLLSNAIKYNNVNGSVTVKAYHTAGNQLAMVFEDTGVGIREEDFSPIFEPFHRIRQGKPIEGTGIGLTVSRKLLEMMDGEIHVNSKVGEGSMFTILIPLGSPENAEYN